MVAKYTERVRLLINNSLISIGFKSQTIAFLFFLLLESD